VALDGVDFTLKQGEVHVLLGENGAGKSTLIKILSGALQKDSGVIRIDDREVQIRHPWDAQALGISTIYQEFNLVPQLSIAENIFLGREQGTGLPGIISRNLLEKETRRVLESLEVGLDPAWRVQDLGVAQKQMVEVAKALSVHSRILIMDEPTSALTRQEIEILFRMMRRLKENGVGIIYISHRLEELIEIGDRLTVLRDGRVIGTREVGAVESGELVRMMVNRELKQQFPRQSIKPGEEILRVENLGRRGVFEQISFSVHRGEIVGIAGLLGAGRTELARALFGVDRVDCGTIRLNARPVSINRPDQAVRLGLALLTEDRKSHGLVLEMSVKDNISLSSLGRFLRLGVLRSGLENRTVSKYVRELRIRTPDINRKVLFLSGGNQQKVVLSKWLCSRGELFIFDEPTRGIDIGAKVEIYHLMNQLTASGAAIIMISSELPEVIGMSDRILVMRRGLIVKEFASRKADQESVMSAALGLDTG
jgi:ribose transport system ATP-binding protein